MATVADWIEGARLRTLPAAGASVVAGSAIALHHDAFSLVRAGLALIVALALQVGVNFANDYSDGIRGTDDDRVGPRRLVASGAAPPRTVKLAAFACFGLASVAGGVLVWISGQWWLLAVGVLSILAAWYYTGGRRPYGYAGLGELFVFVFFGPVAVGGTTLVQLGRVPESAWWAGLSMGALISAILVANNQRDLPRDRTAGKRTLSVRLGDRWSRWLYVALVGVGIFGVVQVALTTSLWALLGLAMVVLFLGPVRLMLGGAVGMQLVTVLKLTGMATLTGAVGMFVGLGIA